MCYSLYISTDSSEELNIYNTELIQFEKLSDLNNDPCTILLDFSNKWYIRSKSGCSCAFRHLISTELGFSEPVDWYEEGQDEIDATRGLYTILVKLLSSGYHVDLIDSWYGTKPEDILTIDVSLDDISISAFRLFENYKFKLKKKTQQCAPPDT